MTIFKLGGLAAAVLSCGLLFSLPLTSEAGAQAVGPAVTTTLNPRGAWSASVSYAANDLVTLRNSSWRALRASKGKLPGSTSPSTAADWALFAGGLNPLGNWKATTAYQRNDLALFNFATWRALRTSLNVTPGTSAADWVVFAARGARGATGPRGLQGPRGPAGPSAVGNGTQAAPVINFTSSPDTGIFSPGGGKLALAENGKLFLHDIGDLNTALGLGALANVTDGSSDTAIGFNALTADTTGFGNTAVGESALRANIDGSSNTALGESTLRNNTSGSSNVAMGSLALRSNTTGIDNTAVGKNALFANIGGGSNTAVGRSALSANTSGSSNTAVGDFAMQVNGTGSQNTAMGDHALFSNTAGNNTAMGFEALKANTTAEENTAVGSQALSANTTGHENTAVGFQALVSNTTGFTNLAVGNNALESNLGGRYNTAIGNDALASSQNSTFNTAVGLETLQRLTAGQFNVALGRQALRKMLTADSNTAIGNQALSASTTGDRNIAVGNFAASEPTGPSDSIFIGNEGLAADTATIKIGTPGTQTTTFIAGIFGAGTSGGIGVQIDSTGKLGTTLSSRRYKEDILPMGAMSDMLARLRPVSFRYKKPYADGSKPIQYGLIAEDVVEVFPYLAVFNKEGQPETVRYQELPTFLLEGFQEQQRTIAAQAEEIARQQAINEAQAKRMAALEQRLLSIEAQLDRSSITTASDSR